MLQWAPGNVMAKAVLCVYPLLTFILSRQLGIQKCLSLSKRSLSKGMKVHFETLLVKLQRGQIILSIILFIYLFMSHLMTLSFARVYSVEWMDDTRKVISEWFGRKPSRLKGGTIQAFAWKNCEKPRRTSDVGLYLLEVSIDIDNSIRYDIGIDIRYLYSTYRYTWHNFLLE